MDELKNFFKNSFGKEKNSRSHAIMMLLFYGMFIVVVIALVRTTPTSSNLEKKENNINKNHEQVEEYDNVDVNSTDSDVNYSYSYVIVYDGITENYLGKKVDDKEKFSYIKDSVSKDYAIVNGNYLILENGSYHIVDNLDSYFKYCDMEKITSMLEYEEYNLVNDKYVYNIDNSLLAKVFSDNILANNNLKNKVELYMENGILKGINLNLDNYISSILGSNHTLNINMEFANIGTTEDFQIKIG